MTEQLHFHFSLSCIGEGNGNPLQCSCLENPRDGEPAGCHLWGRTESDTTEAVQQSSMLITQEIGKVFGALCQEPGAKTKYVFLFLCHRTPISLLKLLTTSKMPFMGSVLNENNRPTVKITRRILHMHKEP